MQSLSHYKNINTWSLRSDQNNPKFYFFRHIQDIEIVNSNETGLNQVPSKQPTKGYQGCPVCHSATVPQATNPCVWATNITFNKLATLVSNIRACRHKVILLRVQPWVVWYFSKCFKRRLTSFPSEAALILPKTSWSCRKCWKKTTSSVWNRLVCTYRTDDIRNLRLMSFSLCKSGSGAPYLRKLKLRASSPNVVNLMKMYKLVSVQQNLYEGNNFKESRLFCNND